MYQARRSSSSSYGSGKSQDNNPKVPAPAKRRRGRPRGNPIPLNKEERRQRNAQYERERRVEMAEAMKDLGAAMGNSDFDNVPNAHLLASVLHKLRCLEMEPPEDLDELRRINAKLEAQIEEAAARLSGMDDTRSTSSSSPDLQSHTMSNYVQMPETTPMLQYPQPSIAHPQANDYWNSTSTSTSASSYTSYGTQYYGVTTSSPEAPDMEEARSEMAVSLNGYDNLAATPSPVLSPLTSQTPEELLEMPHNFFELDEVPVHLSDEELLEICNNLLP